jgi:hypothetical protein
MHAQSVDLLHTLFDGFDRHHVPDRYRHDGGNFVGRGAIHHNALERSRDHDDEYRPAVPVNAGDAGPAGDAAPGNQRGIKLAQQEFEPVLARRQAVICASSSASRCGKARQRYRREPDCESDREGVCRVNLGTPLTPLHRSRDLFLSHKKETTHPHG